MTTHGATEERRKLTAHSWWWRMGCLDAVLASFGTWAYLSHPSPAIGGATVLLVMLAISCFTKAGPEPS